MLGTWAALSKKNPAPVRMQAHTRMITGLQVSLNGQFLASSCLSGKVVLWDFRAKVPLHEMGFRVPIRCLSTADDDFNLVVSIDEALCNVSTQDFLRRYERQQQLLQQQERLRKVRVPRGDRCPGKAIPL